MKKRLHRIPDVLGRFGGIGLVLGFCLCTVLEGASREMHGTTYLNLAEVARRLGMEYSEPERGKEARLSSRWTTMDYQLHQRHFMLNGRRVALGNPIAASQGKLYISERDFTKTIQPLLTPQVFRDSLPALRHIVIDPGHGGNDPGATNTELGLLEKNLTLALARRLQVKLEAMGYRVTLTRTRDEFMGLEQRAEFANRSGADLFISLHFNAVASGSNVSGIETFVLTPQGQPSTASANLSAQDRLSLPGNRQDIWNALAGYHIQDALVAATGARDRGLRRARFAVLRSLNCPGVLIEGGFVTHPVEGRNLGSAAYRERLADAIAEGVLNYQKRLNQIAVDR